MRKKFGWVIITAIIFTSFLLIQTTGIQTASAISDSKVALNHQSMRTSLVDAIKEQAEQKLTHEEVVRISDKFKDLLVQETDESLKVIHYNSKDELLNAFEEIASRDVAATFVDVYYRETNDGLFIIPTATPPWLNEDENYDMIQVSDHKVKIVQENKTDLYGTYTVAIEFTYNNGWRISEIVHS